MITEQSRGLVVAMSIRWLGCRNENRSAFVRDRAMHESGVHLLLFGLDLARAHHLERQFVRAEWARIRRHFRWNRRDLREIHLHIAVTM